MTSRERAGVTSPRCDSRKRSCNLLALQLQCAQGVKWFSLQVLQWAQGVKEDEFVNPGSWNAMSFGLDVNMYNVYVKRTWMLVFMCMWTSYLIYVWMWT